MAIPTLVVGTNTYVTLTDAEDLVDERVFPGSWASATDDDKNRALLQARTLLDNFYTWKGVATSLDLTTQPLDWPRTGVRDEDGRLHPSDTIPTLIKKAQVELAISLLATDISASTSSDEVAEVQADTLKVKFNVGDPSQSSAIVPDYLTALLAGLGSPTAEASGSGGGAVSLLRG